MRGNLFIVSAPSGAGKTTLCRRLCETMQGIEHSVSFTTRKPRPGEVNDRDYTFVSEREFKEMAEEGAFAEWAEVHGSLYGTSKKRLEEALLKGTDVILDIDVQGARTMKGAVKGGIYVFIFPPSMEALMERLRGRMSDSPEDIGERLKTAVVEMREYSRYDYVIVNDILEEALLKLQAIVLARRSYASSVDPAWVEKNFFKEE